MVGVNYVRKFVSDNHQRAAFIAFGAFYLLAILYLQHASARDPTSLFFDTKHGLDPIYSTLRTQQAEEYISHATASPVTRAGPISPRLAVGIATVQRQGKRYFRAAVGSILDGLRESERNEIHLTTFIANSDPTVHSAYNETWLHDLSDKVLTYQDASADMLARIMDLEISDSEHRVKPMLDYIFLLEACYRTGADFIVMLEDDVIGVDGWYHRTIAALDSRKVRQNLGQTIYIRLFFNSGLLGWNSEKWREHLLFSILIAVGVLATLRFLRRYSTSCAEFITLRTTIVVLFVCTPALIGLYYAGGRLTLAPLTPGVSRMDTHGCCSQAFVFPRYRVPELIEFWTQRQVGFIDSLTEEYANMHGLARWAVVPSVFQHVGGQSTKGDSASSAARRIWNYDFELYEPGVLRRQHAETVLS